MGGVCATNNEERICKNIQWSNYANEKLKSQSQIQAEQYFEKILNEEAQDPENILQEQFKLQEEQLWKEYNRLKKIIQLQEDKINQLCFLKENLEDNSSEDQLEINISYFYKKKHSKPIEYPCKHSNCLTIAKLNCNGIVNCEKGCPSYSIKDTAFDVSKNQIFSKSDQNKFGIFVSIQSTTEMAQIIQDSIQRSKLNQNEQNEFCRQFSKVLCLQFVSSKIPQTK